MIENKRPLWMTDRSETNLTEQKKQIKKGFLGELLFFLAFFLFNFKYLFDYSSIMSGRNNTLNSLLVASLLACLMVKISLQHYKPFQLALTVIAGAAIGYSCLISTNYFTLIGMLFVLAMQDIDLEKIFKVSFITKTLSITIHVLAYIVTYFTNPLSINFTYRTGGEPRHNFLMGHSNMFTAFLLWTLLEFIFLNYKDLNIFHVLFVWAVNITFYIFTDTNTGIMVLAMVTALIALDKLGRGLFNGLLTLFAKYSYTFFSLFFAFLISVYTHLSGVLRAIWYAIDNFLTGRIWLGTYAYNTYGFTFLGTEARASEKVFWGDRWFDTFTIFDNSYIGNLVSNGYINIMLLALTFIILSRRMENREKIIIVAFSFYAIMEAYVTNMVICSALFVVGKYLYYDYSKLKTFPESNKTE